MFTLRIHPIHIRMLPLYSYHVDTCAMSRYDIPSRIASHRITSHHIASPRIASHVPNECCIGSCHIGFDITLQTRTIPDKSTVTYPQIYTHSTDTACIIHIHRVRTTSWTRRRIANMQRTRCGARTQHVCGVRTLLRG